MHTVCVIKMDPPRWLLTPRDAQLHKHLSCEKAVQFPRFSDLFFIFQLSIHIANFAKFDFLFSYLSMRTHTSAFIRSTVFTFLDGLVPPIYYYDVSIRSYITLSTPNDILLVTMLLINSIPVCPKFYFILRVFYIFSFNMLRK